MKILLAIDGSPCSELALAEVARSPWPSGSTVCVATVESPLQLSSLGDNRTTLDEYVENRREAARRRLKAAAEKLHSGEGIDSVLARLLEGNPKDAIVEAAEEWGADLVVVGSHGYGPLRRFFLGSVSQYVAHHAPCSVLIVRCRPDSCPVPGHPA